MTTHAGPRWVVCQIGAREHYSLAAEFYRRGRLTALVTDLWVRPGSPMARLAALAGSSGRALQDRYLAALDDARVITPGAAGVTRQVLSRICGRRLWSWEDILEANRRLSADFAARLRCSRLLAPDASGSKPVVFSYSYGGLEVLSEARRQGCPTVLAQIDPGPRETALVEQIAASHGLPNGGPVTPPWTYWDRWRDECAIADRIIVNSQWSRKLLVEAGLVRDKIVVIPLAFEASVGLAGKQVALKKKSGPLRLLFLGQVCVRKGILELLEAMHNLTDTDMRLTVIGKFEDRLAGRLQPTDNVEFLGPVPRSAVDVYYRNADLFVFPTHSDGFGLTQLEAMAAGLPVMASRSCGDVVRDGVDGRLLAAVTANEIETVLRWFYGNQEKLKAMRSCASERAGQFGSGRVAALVDKAVEGIAA